MMNDHDEIIKQLHELADWIEKNNGVHCMSVPRKAAYLIAALQADYDRLWLLNNKRDVYLIDYINRVIGYIRLQWYLFKIGRAHV